MDFKEKMSTYDLSQAAHPMTCIFTVLFKIIAIARFQLIVFDFYYFSGSYYTLGMFLDCSNAFIFIIVILACALDFWVMKNISGR